MSRREVVEQLAEYGISLQQTSLRRIEEGTQAVKIEEAQALAGIFNISFDHFVRFPIDPEKAALSLATKHYDLKLRLALIHVQTARIERLTLQARKEEAEEQGLSSSIEGKKATELLNLTVHIDAAMQELLYTYGDSGVDYSDLDVTEEKLSEILAQETAIDDGEG